MPRTAGKAGRTAGGPLSGPAALRAAIRLRRKLWRSVPSGRASPHHAVVASLSGDLACGLDLHAQFALP